MCYTERYTKSMLQTYEVGESMCSLAYFFLLFHGLKNYKNVAEETKRAMDRIEVINSSYKDFLEKHTLI